MLKEIYCDKFITNGNIRSTIRFHKGLNTVLGTNDGSNSIGKSTFLMIIDFVFGGNDYIEKSIDVIDNVGHHTIFFTFEFEGVCFKYSRSTDEKNVVKKYNEANEYIGSIAIEDYRTILYEKYNMKSTSQSFRGAVSPYFRIYLRECIHEDKPLKVSNNTPDRDGITELLKLFDKYENIALANKKYKVAKDEEDAFKKSINFNHIPSPLNLKEYNNNLKEIEELEKQIDELSQKSKDGLIELDSLKAKEISNIKHELSKLRRQQTRLKSDLMSLASESLDKNIIKNDFKELLKYFPDANVGKLTEVESFHYKLIEALKSEIADKKNNINALLEINEQNIKLLENKMREINDTPNVSSVILDKYSELKAKCEKLKQANLNYDEKSKLKNNVKTLDENITILTKNELSTVEPEINDKMKEYNEFIYDSSHSSPVIKIDNASKYTFVTTNDMGTGSRYKGLIVFDLAILRLTCLPAVAHDSFMLKQIENGAIEKILELYFESDKQIFISLDKETSYSKRTQEILSDTEVLRLSSNGNELFGKSWNKNDENKHIEIKKENGDERD